jgi:hypothetical protein
MTTFGQTIRTGMAAALLLAGITTGVQGQVSGGGLRIGVLWRANLVPCNLDICGGFLNNVATLGLEKGSVAVKQSGLVSINRVLKK